MKQHKYPLFDIADLIDTGDIPFSSLDEYVAEDIKPLADDVDVQVSSIQGDSDDPFVILTFPNFDSWLGFWKGMESLMEDGSFFSSLEEAKEEYEALDPA